MAQRPYLFWPLLLAVVLLGGGLGLRQCHRAEQRTTAAEAARVREQRRADSLAVELRDVATYLEADSLHRAAHRASANARNAYETIRRNPARGWSDDSLRRYLSDPYRLHAPRAGR